jgi:hypothetical protein
MYLPRIPDAKAEYATGILRAYAEGTSALPRSANGLKAATPPYCIDRLNRQPIAEVCTSIRSGYERVRSWLKSNLTSAAGAKAAARSEQSKNLIWMTGYEREADVKLLKC